MRKNFSLFYLDFPSTKQMFIILKMGNWGIPILCDDQKEKVDDSVEY